MMMMLDELRALCLQAMQDDPHVEQVKTLENLRYLRYAERVEAANCYKAIIGERTLPNDHGIAHKLRARRMLEDRASAIESGKPQVVRSNSAQSALNAKARRILEERKDMA